MEKKHITSEEILSAGYDPATSVLELEFFGGALYQYADVPPEIYDGLMAANAPDRYFAQHIKNKFKFFEID